MPPVDVTWSETTVYACSCGVVFPATYWRWVDRGARPEIAQRVRDRGPVEGQCPSCSMLARSDAPWLLVDSKENTATLVLSEAHRATVIDELKRHLDSVAQRPESCAEWFLSPQLEFVGLKTEGPKAAQRHVSRAIRARPAQKRAGPQKVAPVPGEDPPPAMVSGVPQIISTDVGRSRPPPSLGSYVAELKVDGGRVVAQLDLPDPFLEKWKGAKLDARPILLRNFGYPLVGARIIGAYLGQQGCIDALVEVGAQEANEVFRLLSERFELRLVAHGSERFDRSVCAEGLEPNAALCIESARGVLGAGEYPPDGFERATEQLASIPVDKRLEKGPTTIDRGSYLHIVGAREAAVAVEHLDRISQKEPLSQLLEVDGFPMGEYDAIRRRILVGSLEHGLVAPRRFWRRVVASGLAEDLTDYVNRLAEARKAHEGEEGDLDPGQAHAAWERIFELCERKGILPPEPVRQALGLMDVPPEELVSAASARSKSQSGVIVANDRVGSGLEANLRDPALRLKAATEVLQQGRTQGAEIGLVFDALDSFDTHELLAILPDLSDLGPRAVPGLIPKLRSDRREVRQVSVILLGMALDPDALIPLVDLLLSELTSVWLDVARALGAYGPVSLGRLRQTLEEGRHFTDEKIAIERVGRTLAEIVLSEGGSVADEPRPGRDAVAALATAEDPRVRAAARLALATLDDVSASGAAVRGETSMAEITEVRGFARRAYEAILVPEVEVEAEV